MVALTGRRSRLDRLTSLADLPIGTRRRATTVNARQTQHRLTDAKLIALVQAYQAGIGIADLAQQFGVHRSTVGKLLTRMAVPRRTRGLSVEQLNEAEKLYRQGWSFERLGERFRCHPTTVQQRFVQAGIARRKPWERQA